MSIDLSKKGTGVFYLNFRTAGTGSNNARAIQEFNFGNLVEQSGDYIIAIERLSLPLHRIPMINVQAPALIFEPTGAGILFTINTPEAYSWKQWLDNINEQLNEIPNIDTSIFMDQSGRMRMDSAVWADYNIRFSDTLRDIFDINQVVGLPDTNNNNEVIGRSSMVDRFDQLHKIQIEALGMNLQQEIIDTDRSLPIITDLIVPNEFSISYEELLDTNTKASENVNIGYTVRQNLNYFAESNPRFVMLRGATPIQNIIIQCVAIYKDNTRNEIILPPRSVFELKIAFFKR